MTSLRPSSGTPLLDTLRQDEKNDSRIEKGFCNITSTAYEL